MAKNKFIGIEKELREKYEAGKTLSELRREFGLTRSDYALKKAIIRAGGDIRPVMRYEDHSPEAARQRVNDNSRRSREKHRERINARARELRAIQKEATPHIQGQRSELSKHEQSRILTLFEAGNNFKEIASELGRTGNTVARFLRQHHEIRKRPVRRGERSPSWKGGRWIDQHGYVYVRVDGHMIYEHRRVMAERLGRQLDPHETVHHINGDRTDNRPENLQLRHGRHGKGTAPICLDCGSRNIGSAPLAETAAGPTTTAE